MYIAEKLRKTNIAEYLLYMWQVEDIIRAYGCDLLRIRREYVSTFHLEGDALDEEETWWHNLVRMMKEEGVAEQGHLQINKVTMQLLCDMFSVSVVYSGLVRKCILSSAAVQICPDQSGTYSMDHDVSWSHERLFSGTVYYGSDGCFTDT